MDTAFGALRSASVIFIVVAIAFGTYAHQVAKVTASAAAVAAAAAAAQSLDATGWDCTDTGPHWQAAHEAAAAATARAAGAASVTATDYTLLADPACTVLVSVRAGAAGARAWLEATSVACRPTRAATSTGWALPPPC